MKMSSVALAIFLAGTALAAPFAIYPVFLMKIFCFALLASAFNLLVGFTGLMSFGHAALFGTGGYMAGLFILHCNLTPELALVAAAAASGVLGLAMGALAIRRHGIYFSMVTLALSQMVFFFYLQSRFTGGEDGMQGVPRGRLFGLISLSNDLALYYVVLVVFALALLLIWRTVNSPFGRVLMAIRGNEKRALSLGYDVWRFKLATFGMSAALTGLAGGLKAIVFGFATLADAHWHTSGEAIFMTLLGGIGTFVGPIVGASFVVVLQDTLADKVGSKITVIMGLIFMACVLVFRNGIVGATMELASRDRRSCRS